MIALYIVLALIVAFIAVILIRAARFKPPAERSEVPEEVAFDREGAVSALQELVRCRTVSYYDHTLEDDAEFEKFIALLPTLYPEVARVCSLTRLPDRGLLYKWEGEEQGEPVILMSHYDVVPVNEEGWTKPLRCRHRRRCALTAAAAWTRAHYEWGSVRRQPPDCPRL